MTKNKEKALTKIEEIRDRKINVFFKRSILNSILKILTMEHNGFRTFKSVKNINRLFNSLDLSKYKKSDELLSYIWAIRYISHEWLEGLVDINLILEKARREDEYDSLKGDIINNSINDKNIITAPEIKMLFNLIAEALQFGYVTAMKDEYLSLLDDIDLDNPAAFKELVNRLFLISESLMDIKYNTNLVANRITFNTADSDSIKESISQTISSLSSSSNVFKTGIRRLNTLLSPGYMNGRIYVYLGAPGSAKSMLLLKSALDIRKYNTDYVGKTPGMKPCVLYITMENSFIETIERVWNLSFDDPITNYTDEEAAEKISKELGVGIVEEVKENTLSSLLDEKNTPCIEVVIKYFPYRDISTDDLLVIIQDLRDENLEVCALVLDYIKRIRPSVPTPDNVKVELDRIMNELKAISVLKDIPVITAHQLNRAAAAVLDGATRIGRGDTTKLVGREHVGSAYEIIEVADFASVLNIEYKPGTDDRYMVVNVVKRRRVDTADSDFAKYTYLAHPFSKTNGFRLVDDINLDKVLSVQSLVTDISDVGKEKTNAVPRLKVVEVSEFEEFDD